MFDSRIFSVRKVFQKKLIIRDTETCISELCILVYLFK